MQNDAYRLKINLGEKKESKFSGIFVKWAVTRGRIIVVVVELLALGALGYRFFIDQQIVDLNEQINKQQVFIEAQAQKEAQYRNIQTRIQAIQQISNETSAKVGFLKQLFSDATRNNFLSSSFSLVDDTISIDGQASSIFTLNTFIEEVKQNENVSAISLEDLSTLDQGVRFRLVITLKKSNIVT